MRGAFRRIPSPGNLEDDQLPVPAEVDARDIEHASLLRPSEIQRLRAHLPVARLVRTVQPILRPTWPASPYADTRLGGCVDRWKPPEKPPFPSDKNRGEHPTGKSSCTLTFRLPIRAEACYQPRVIEPRAIPAPRERRADGFNQH